MLISKRIRIGRILSGTWRHTIFDILTCVASYFAYIYFVDEYFEVPAIIPTILGTALSFFIGFMNNQAYDRWWEARKIWGELVNDSRSWAREVMSYTQPTPDIDANALKTVREKGILRHISFVYALKENLRGTTDREFAQYLDKKDIDSIDSKSNKANTILDLQSQELQKWYDHNLIDGFKFIEMNKLLVRFSDEMGKSERIANTIFPTTYYYYTRIFIFIFIISLTMFTANYIAMWSILVGALIGYIFLTTHKIGETLVDPFKGIPTGIPLNQISRTIEINLLETMDATEIPEPLKIANRDYVM